MKLTAPTQLILPNFLQLFVCHYVWYSPSYVTSNTTQYDVKSWITFKYWINSDCHHIYKHACNSNTTTMSKYTSMYIDVSFMRYNSVTAALHKYIQCFKGFYHALHALQALHILRILHIFLLLCNACNACNACNFST